MFNISLSEWLILGVVALLVIRPDNLPEIARTLGGMVRKVQRFMSDVKSDLDHELSHEDLADFRKLHEELQGARRTATRSSHEMITGLMQEDSPSILPDTEPVAAPVKKKRRRRRRTPRKSNGAGSAGG